MKRVIDLENNVTKVLSSLSYKPRATQELMEMSAVVRMKATRPTMIYKTPPAKATRRNSKNQESADDSGDLELQVPAPGIDA